MRAPGRGLRVSGYWLSSEVAASGDLIGRGFDATDGGLPLGVVLEPGTATPSDWLLQLEGASVGVSGRAEGWAIRDTNGRPAATRLALRVIFALQLRDEGGLVIHASSVLAREKAWLFLGPPGIGKSTFATNAHAPRLADDTVIIRRYDRGLIVHGTPFGKEDVVGCDGAVPAGALCFLSQSPMLAVRRIPSAAEAARRLAAQIFLPPGDEKPSAAMWQSILDLTASVAAYELAVPLGHRFDPADLEEGP